LGTANKTMQVKNCSDWPCCHGNEKSQISIPNWLYLALHKRYNPCTCTQ